MITRTHNGHHLGDNLVHLHFLRKVALANPDRQFIHAAQWQYLPQLKDLVEDIANLSLTDFNYMTPSDSIDAWRGANGFWYQHPNRNDFVTFHLEAWFPYLAKRMEVENPMRNPNDMLFDYPAIQKKIEGAECDILFISSPPGSGQFPSFSSHALADLAARLVCNHNNLINPSPPRPGWPSRTITEIGHFSLYCHTILMVSTGPSWPTFNVWNQDSVKLRIILLEPERVNLAPNTVHVPSVEDAEFILKDHGFL